MMSNSVQETKHVSKNFFFTKFRFIHISAVLAPFDQNYNGIAWRALKHQYSFNASFPLEIGTDQL